MHIPEKRQRDLCKVDLEGPYAAMSYPLDAKDRAQLRETMRAEMPAPIRAMLGDLHDPTPNCWRFDFCRGCVDGFMPMLAELKTQAIAAWLAERARRAQPVGDPE